MVRWSEFADQSPDLAEAGRAMFYQYGPGLGFLATVRPDGGPRLHPVCPIVGNGGLYLALVPSRKSRDLLRDPRFALHAMLPEEVDDEFVVTGRAVEVDSPDGRADVQANYAEPDPRRGHGVRTAGRDRTVGALSTPRGLAADVHQVAPWTRRRRPRIGDGHHLAARRRIRRGLAFSRGGRRSEPPLRVGMITSRASLPAHAIAEAAAMTDLEAAWAELDAANATLGWIVRRPSLHDEVRGAEHFELWAYDPTEKPTIGRRSREWTARGATEVDCVREMARALRDRSERVLR